MQSDQTDLERRLDDAHAEARNERIRTDLAEEHLRSQSSELAADNAELMADNAELESFGAMVSHDLHSPVRAMLGFTRALQERYADVLDDEGRRLLSVVHSEATRMGNLIDDLLIFSRLGSEVLGDVEIDMTRLARDVANEQAGLLPSPVAIEQLPNVRGDPVLLRQVWTNLVANAVKFSSKNRDAHVSIFANMEPARIVYNVRDDGVGFDMKNAGEVFEVFRRLHRSDEFPGTGVGLAIVKRIVERHGGTVWAESRPGEGATFSFALPTHG